MLAAAMAATFTCDDLEQLASIVAATWRAAADRDWSARAGTLEWSCAQTADHAVDTVLAPAFFLASRRLDAYPDGGWSPGLEATAEQFAAAVETTSRILSAVVTATAPDVRAIIWRRPAPESRGPADFVPRGALELILHAHDVCAGLGVAFDPPADVCDRLRAHTSDWPFWQMGGAWSPLTMADDPWADLLRASGRLPVSSDR